MDCRTIRAVPRGTPSGTEATAAGAQSYNAQDWGRKFLSSNGGCIYIDLESPGAGDPRSAQCLRPCGRVARDAADRAARLEDGEREAARRAAYPVARQQLGRPVPHRTAATSTSWSRGRAWNNIFNRKLHYQLFLASHQVSSIVYTGQGKVGSENGAPAADFQLSQRADFFETLTGSRPPTTGPLVNSRDESLCGKAGSNSDTEMARLHCIFFDAGLCHGACLLKVGVMQIVLAMIEAEQVDSRILLDDPAGCRAVLEP